MKKGFTLLELLIVIGILAVLAAVVTLVLNPAEILKQTRDGKRLSDLDALKSAIAFHLSTAVTPSVIYGQITGATSTVSLAGAACPFSASCVANTGVAVNGSGWVTVNFNDTSGGSPLSVLPLDPVNSGNYYYAYSANAASSTFELDARLESEKHRAKMTQDGGNNNTCTGGFVDSTCYYEIGNDPGLDL